MTSAAIRKSLLMWPRARLTGMALTLPRVGRFAGPLDRAPDLSSAASTANSASKPPLASVRVRPPIWHRTVRLRWALHRSLQGPGPARARTKTRLRRTMNESSRPPRAAMPQIRAGSWPGSWVMVRLTHWTVTGERDRALAVRQLQRLADQQQLRIGGQLLASRRCPAGRPTAGRRCSSPRLPGVGDQAHHRVVRGGEHGLQDPADLDRGRHEDAGEAELLRLRVGYLQHALGQEVPRGTRR
jgi:hypothetical protein